MILVTGASSFLGKNLLPILKSATDEEILTPSSKFLNLLDISSVRNYFDQWKPDAILHMAAICGGIGANSRSPADFAFLNSQMAINLFEMIRKHNIKYYYGLGSVCAYPTNCPVPFKEDDMFNGFPEETNSGYGEAKRLQYILFKTHKQQYNLKGTFLVPVNLMGYHDHFDLENSHVIPALIHKFVDARYTGADVECWGTGEVTREFLFAEDCAKAIVKCVANRIDYDKPINLGTGVDISIKDLAELIAELDGFKGKIIFNGNESINGQQKRLLDVSRAKKVLNWRAENDLRSSLKKTLAWYKKNYLNVTCMSKI